MAAQGTRHNSNATIKAKSNERAMPSWYRPAYIVYYDLHENKDDVFELIRMADKDADFNYNIEQDDNLFTAFENRLLYFYHGEQFDENILSADIFETIRKGLFNYSEFAIAQKERLRQNARYLSNDEKEGVFIAVDNALKQASELLKAFEQYSEEFKVERKRVVEMRKMPNDVRDDAPETADTDVSDGED